MNGVVRNLKALSIETTSQIPSLTKGQKALLFLIRSRVEGGKALDFESILMVYYNNVRKTFSRGIGWTYTRNEDGSPTYGSGRYAEYIQFDILECWKKQEYLFEFKPQVRQWFVSNIGILVIKNQLVIVPTIDLE